MLFEQGIRNRRTTNDRWLMWAGGVLLLVPASALLSWMLLLIVEVVLVGIFITEVRERC
jgi:hypothetical protein